MLDLEYFGVIPTFYDTGRDYTLEAGDVFIRIAVHILRFTSSLFWPALWSAGKKGQVTAGGKESALISWICFFAASSNGGHGIMTTTLQGRIKTFNRSAEKITGRRFDP